MDASSSSSSLKGSSCDVVNLKILIPSMAAGAIIGKGGETIAEIQKKSGGRMRMSKANDHYPGTNERVCLITGSLEAVGTILDFVLEKQVRAVRPAAATATDPASAERDKQVKVVIPNSTAGMIIGKGGSFIKQIKDESGAFIQISQKSSSSSKGGDASERVVTVMGEVDNNRRAMAMILDKICEDPQSGQCPNLSYRSSSSPPTTDSGMMMGGDASPTPSTSTSTSTPFILPLHGGGALQLEFNMNPNRSPTDPSLVAQYLDHIKSALHSSRYNDMAVDEIVRAVSCLALHGVLVVNLVTTTTTNRQPLAAAAGGFDGGFYGSHYAARSYWSNGSGNDVAAPPPPPPPHHVMAVHHPTTTSPFSQHPPHSPSSKGGNKNSFGLATGPPPATSSQNGHLDHLLIEPPPPPHQNEMEMAISESIIGAVIGPQGKSIVDIQQVSGARIQISKKGTFSPGTRNRIVHIQGSQEAIKKAQYWIQKKVEEEGGKRERNSSKAAAAAVVGNY